VYKAAIPRAFQNTVLRRKCGLDRESRRRMEKNP
jgi:hypothetical protein